MPAPLVTALRRVRHAFDLLHPRDVEILRRCDEMETLRRSMPYTMLTMALPSALEPHAEAIPYLVRLFPWASHHLDEGFDFGACLRRICDDRPGLEAEIALWLQQALAEGLELATRSRYLAGLLRHLTQAGHTVDWGLLGADLLAIDAGEADGLRWARRFWVPRSVGVTEA